MKPEGKLTIITDYGEGKSIVVDGVSMETVEKLKCCGNCAKDDDFDTYRNHCINCKYFKGENANNYSYDNWTMKQ